MTRSVKTPGPVVSLPARAGDGAGATRAGPRRPAVGAAAPGPGVEAAAQARAAAIDVLQRICEVLDLRRPRGHLAHAVTEAVVLQVAELQRVRHRGGAPPVTKVRRVHIQLSADGVAEIFGSVTCGDRVRAIAGRLSLLPVRAPRPQSGRRKAVRRWVLVEFALL